MINSEVAMRQNINITVLSFSAVTKLSLLRQLAKSHNHISGINGTGLRMGRPTVLTEHKEQLIVNHVKLAAQRKLSTDILILKPLLQHSQEPMANHFFGNVLRITGSAHSARATTISFAQGRKQRRSKDLCEVSLTCVVARQSSKKVRAS